MAVHMCIRCGMHVILIYGQWQLYVCDGMCVFMWYVCTYVRMCVCMYAHMLAKHV